MGGGFFTAVKKEIPCFERKDLSQPGIESVWCQASLSNQADDAVLFGAFYRPPNEKAKTSETLGDALAEIYKSKKSPHIILGGDFNVPGLDWSEDPVEPKNALHDALINVIQENHITQTVNFPTRQDANETKYTHDLLLTTHPSLMSNAEPSPGISDYCIVKASVSTKTKIDPISPRKIYLWKDVPEEEFKMGASKLQSDYFDRNPESKTVEQNWSWFRNNLCNIFEDLVPTKLIKGRMRSPWFTSKLKRLCKKRRNTTLRQKNQEIIRIGNSS